MAKTQVDTASETGEILGWGIRQDGIVKMIPERFNRI